MGAGYPGCRLSVLEIESETDMTSPPNLTLDEWDALFETAGDRLARLQRAFRNHPQGQNLLWANPLIGISLPWVVIALPDRSDSQVGLLVKGAHTKDGWLLDRPFTLLLDNRNGVGDLVEIDPNQERIGRPQIFPGDYDPTERPDTAALLQDVSRASAAWSADAERVARWAALAVEYRMGPVPTDYAELRFGRDVYRGLIVDGPYDPDDGWDFDAVLTLFCSNGRLVNLDASQADAVEVFFSVEITVDE